MEIKITYKLTEEQVKTLTEIQHTLELMSIKLDLPTILQGMMDARTYSDVNIACYGFDQAMLNLKKSIRDSILAEMPTQIGEAESDGKIK